MKIFIAALFAAAALAQEEGAATEEAPAEKTMEQHESEFAGTLEDFLSENVQTQAFDAVAGGDGEASLSGNAHLMETLVGVKFMAMDLTLTDAPAKFATGTYNYLYFQVEHPIFPPEEDEEHEHEEGEEHTEEEAAPETEETEEPEEETPPPTGTGMYEGMGIVAKSAADSLAADAEEGDW